MTSQYLNSLLLFSTAFIAGGLNAVAGGGSFLMFPALIFTGIQPIPANATNNFVAWSSSLSSAAAYRQDLTIQRRDLWLMCGTSLLGGVLGSIALLYTPPDLFKQLIPYLLLFATLIFSFSEQLRNLWKFKRNEFLSDDLFPPIRKNITLLLFQLAIAIYGGFFGAGIGILILATLSLLGIQDIHKMNALKTVLTTVINGVAIIPFMIAGMILWHQAILMAVGTSLGSYLCVKYIRKLPPSLVRYFVIFIAYSMTIYFFIHRL